MENYNRAKTIKDYFNKIDSGELEFSQLRNILEKNNIEKDEIDTIIPIIDRKILRAVEIKADNAKGKNMFYGGLILSTIGLIVTIGSYTGLIDLKGFMVIAYGPILGGFTSAMIGKAKMDRDY